MASRQTFPLVTPEERQRKTPSSLTRTSWSPTWRSWPRRSAVRGAGAQPAPVQPSLGAPRPRRAPAPRTKGDAPAAFAAPATLFEGRGGEGGTQTLSTGAASPGSPASSAPAVAGLRAHPAGGEGGAGSTEPEQGAPPLTHSHWRRQQQPLTIMFPCILAV